MQPDLDLVARDLRDLTLTLRLMRVDPSLPPRLISTLDTGIAAAEHALAQCKASEPDSLTAT